MHGVFFDHISLFYLSYATNLHDDLFHSIMLVWYSDRFHWLFARRVFNSWLGLDSRASIYDVFIVSRGDTPVLGAKDINGRETDRTDNMFCHLLERRGWRGEFAWICCIVRA